jgi:large conductance mechanosensitive channel
MKIINEFKEFINRGNVLDLAVAVITGAAFTSIVNSLVGDIVTPLLSFLTQGIDYSSLALTIGTGDNAASIRYGMFIQSVINFLIISVVIFLVVKAMNKVARKQPKPEVVSHKTCPYCAEEIPVDAVRCPLCTTVLDEDNVPPGLR